MANNQTPKFRTSAAEPPTLKRIDGEGIFFSNSLGHQVFIFDCKHFYLLIMGDEREKSFRLVHQLDFIAEIFLKRLKFS